MTINYKLAKDIIIKKRGDIYFGLNMLNGTTYEMNDTQYDIISFFEAEPSNVLKLVEHLCSLYQIEESEILEDVEDSVAQLLKIGVLSLVD